MLPLPRPFLTVSFLNMKNKKQHFNQRIVPIFLCILCILGIQNISANISTITSDSKEISVAGQDSEPFDTQFNSTGTKMYVLGYTTDTVYQYTLSTPWDVSTATYDTISFSVNAQEPVPEGLFFRPDGSTMYVVGVQNNTVYQYTLSTPWDLSTASYASKSSPSNGGNDGTTVKVHFNSDGSKMYLTGFINSRIYQYTLSTPWDVSTATYDSVSGSISQASNSYASTFSHDGKKVFAISPGDVIYQYTLSTAWDISTISYDSLSYNFNSVDSSLYGITLKDDDTKAYFTGATNDKVYQYTIDLTDLTAPTVQTLSPADNATGVAVNANLVITFSESVDRETGNIVIKKTSDDSTVETIDVTSGNVTGTGTNTITINPTSDFAELTEYYVQIDATAFDDAASNSYAGIADTTSWSFTTADITAPVASSVSATPGDTTATITWTTDENASSQVEYGLTTSYGNQTVESDTTPRVTSHSVALSGLNACTLYHYRVKSTDGSTNTVTGTDNTFSTTGCAGSATVVTTGSQTITKAAGGSFQLDSGTADITLTVPINFAAPASAEFQLHQITSTDVVNNIGKPSGKSIAGEHTYNLLALTDVNTTITSFDNPLTILITYTDAEVSALIESTLKIYRWDGAAWNELSNCAVNTGANTVTCETSNFSTFGVFGTATPTTTSSGGGGGVKFIPKADSTTGIATMREWGGMVSKDMGNGSVISAEFLKDTFEKEVNVSISPKAKNDLPEFTEGLELLGNLMADIDVSFKYGIGTIEKPGILHFEYTPKSNENISLVSIYHLNEEDETWELVPTLTEAYGEKIKIDVETKDFSIFAMVGKYEDMIEEEMHSSASRFSDVPSSHRNISAIQWMKENNIVEGYDDGTFKPEKKVNRAEFVKILMETISTSEEVKNCTKTTFRDVPNQSWYAPYVCMAQKKGIIQGYPDGTFRPSQNITFPEAAKIVAESLNLDLPKSSAGAIWYEPYIEALSLKKAIPTTISNLQYQLNRGEMAEQIWRIKENITNLSSRRSYDF